MTVSIIKEWFNRAVPEPTDANRRVQVGVHFEEVAEMLSSMGTRFMGKSVEYFAVELKSGRMDLGEVDRIELLDALCDQIVTAIGVAHMYGMDIDNALKEVSRSNWSKFVDGEPMFDANGKIAKPPTYSPPDLTSYV